MRNLTLLLIAGLLCIAMVNCKEPAKLNTNRSFEISLSTNKTPEVEFTSFFDFDSITLIQLEYNDSLILSNDLFISMQSESIVVYDAMTTQLYHFDSNGKFVNRIASAGASYNEYANVQDVQVDTCAQTIDVLCSSGNTIKTFDFNGNFIRDFKTPVNAGSFAKVKDNLYFLYSGFSQSVNNYRVHLCDTQKVIKSFLPLKTRAFDFTERNFKQHGEIGYFRELLMPNIFKYDSTGVKGYIEIDFGKGTITEGDLEKVNDPFSFFEKVSNKGFYSTFDFDQNNNIAVIRTEYQKGGDMHVFDLFVDLTDQTTTKVIPDNSGIGELMSAMTLIGISNNNTLYYSASPILLKNLLSKDIEGIPEPIFAPLGNPIIFTAPLKKQ